MQAQRSRQNPLPRFQLKINPEQARRNLAKFMAQQNAAAAQSLTAAAPSSSQTPNYAPNLERPPILDANGVWQVQLITGGQSHSIPYESDEVSLQVSEYLEFLKGRAIHESRATALAMYHDVLEKLRGQDSEIEMLNGFLIHYKVFAKEYIKYPQSTKK